MRKIDNVIGAALNICCDEATQSTLTRLDRDKIFLYEVLIVSEVAETSPRFESTNVNDFGLLAFLRTLRDLPIDIP